MSDQLKELFDTVRPVFMALAFLGAMAAQSFWRPASLWAGAYNCLMGTALTLITVPAGFEFARWLWPEMPAWSGYVQGAAYFWVGVAGMQLAPLAPAAIKWFMSLRPKVNNP